MPKTDLIELQAAYDALMDGDPKARARLCLCLQPLVKAWARKKVGVHSGMYLDPDVLAGEGDVAVLEQIDRLAKRERQTHTNLKGLFSGVIRDAMNTFIGGDALIAVPKKSRRRGRNRLKAITDLARAEKREMTPEEKYEIEQIARRIYPAVESLSPPDPDETGDGFEIVDEFEPSVGGDLIPSEAGELIAELLDWCVDEIDEAILLERLGGLTKTQIASEPSEGGGSACAAVEGIDKQTASQAAIATRLGISQASVSERLAAIQQRYRAGQAHAHKRGDPFFGDESKPAA